MKCKHIVSMESIKHRCEVIAPEFREGDSLGCMTWWTCSKCGDVVPQEKANDDPEGDAMTLDEVEKLARLFAEHHDPEAVVTCDDSVHLARAVLAMLPVVKAALAHESVRRECQRTGRHHGMLVLASEMLEDAVDTFTATSASEGK